MNLKIFSDNSIFAILTRKFTLTKQRFSFTDSLAMVAARHRKNTKKWRNGRLPNGIQSVYLKND